MAKRLIYITASILASCLPANAVEIISAKCNNGLHAALKISGTQVSVTGSPSAFNLKSTLSLNGISKAGYTAIFYGGQSKFFRSYDGDVAFNSTIGHGESRQLSTIELQTRSGRYSCIIK